MKYQVHWWAAAVIIVLLVLWQVSTYSEHWRVGKVIVNYGLSRISSVKEMATSPQPRCSLSKVCPPDFFAFSIRSGAANIVGPKICVDGKIIMSHVLNNVGPGLNIVLVNGENGDVENYKNFNFGHTAEELLTYLKDIQPGKIILAASFDDLAAKMTDEAREFFAKFGSSFIKSLKSRDSWVFAGSTGTEHMPTFEKHSTNSENTNTFDGWPEAVEIGGCFPRIITDVDQL